MMDRYSVYFSWSGGDDTSAFSATSDRDAMTKATEHARMPWKRWPPRMCGFMVSISLHKELPGGFQSVGTFEVDR